MSPFPACYMFHPSKIHDFIELLIFTGDCLINLLKNTNDDWLPPWKTGVNLWIVSSVPRKKLKLLLLLLLLLLLNLLLIQIRRNSFFLVHCQNKTVLYYDKHETIPRNNTFLEATTQKK
jgi:hypothetical protein